MMQTLYSLVDTDDIAKKDLYIRGSFDKLADGVLSLKKGEILDFSTYFNSFSLKKWKRYTTLETVRLSMAMEGHFRVIFHVYGENGAPTDIKTESNDSHFEYSFSVKDLDGVILGFTLECLSDTGLYGGGEWQGQFSHWNDKKIGISITTFKREAYVKKTISVLRQFQKTHPWLSVLVVDNGSTLEEEQDKGFRLIHNRNFGGSGGFTRGMIEYMDQGSVDYVLLMDDDIVLEPSAIERTWSLLSGLRDEYMDSFLSGAMLKLEEPCIQYENTAHWGKIRLHGEGKDYNLTDIKLLASNEKVPSQKNRYGAWWYCAVPTRRILEIGYPLPVFVKGDDMEYGIRNHREVMSMNGIGVWHQSFQSKISPVVNYYSDRNMLIINNYAEGCGFLTLVTAIAGRIVKRTLQGNLKGIQCLGQALSDYNSGMSGITAIPSDEKMARLLQLFKQPSGLSVWGNLACHSLSAILGYRRIHKDYVTFRETSLSSSRFWKDFLGMRGNHE